MVPPTLRGGSSLEEQSTVMSVAPKGNALAKSPQAATSLRTSPNNPLSRSTLAI